MKKIKLLKFYKEILLECKKIQISNQLSSEIENNIPTKEKNKQKILTLFR